MSDGYQRWRYSRDCSAGAGPSVLFLGTREPRLLVVLRAVSIIGGRVMVS